MKAVPFKDQNIVIAENQEEYENLPALAQTNGIISFCMELDEKDIEKVTSEGVANITVLNFGGPVQPIAVSVHKPEFPISPTIHTDSNPKSWDDENGTATFGKPLTKMETLILEKTKVLWISTITYGRPLQPISQTL